MEQQQTTGEQYQAGIAGTDRVIGHAPTYVQSTARRFAVPAVETEYRTDYYGRRDNVRWGPVLAGAATAFGVTVILSVLGLAIGASAFEPGTDLSDWTTSAGIWGIITMIAAFFVAGFVAGRTAAVWSSMQAAINGFVAGAVYVTAMTWVAASIGSNFLGFLGSNVASISGVATGATNTAVNDYDPVKDAAWGTFIVLAAGMVIALVAGMIGHGAADAMDDASA